MNNNQISYRVDDTDIVNSYFELLSYTTQTYQWNEIDFAIEDYNALLEGMEILCSKTPQELYFVSNLEFSSGVLFKGSLVIIDIRLYKVK